MDSFLDTTIIIKNFEYNYKKEELRKKCFEYIEYTKGKILISYIIKEELRRVILKRKEMYNYVLKKIENSSYEMDPIYLNKEEIKFAQGLYLSLKQGNLINLKKDFDSEIGFLNASLSSFLKNRIDEIAISKLDLDKFLLSTIHDFIDDFADCRVLTSAVQIQQNKEIFFFVTADKHFDPNGYNFIKTEPKLENYKFPELKNLLYAH